MNERLNQAITDLINELESTSCIKTIKECKAKIKAKPELIEQINDLSNVKDKYELISARQDLYKHEEINELQQNINQLNLLILALNKKLSTLNPVYICQKDT